MKLDQTNSWYGVKRYGRQKKSMTTLQNGSIRGGAKNFPFLATDCPLRGRGVPPLYVNLFPLNFLKNIVGGGPGIWGYPLTDNFRDFRI